MVMFSFTKYFKYLVFFFPSSSESLVKKFSGNGVSKYSDGDASSATFNKPRSFTMDFKGNVYVADRSNYAVRKISPSGSFYLTFFCVLITNVHSTFMHQHENLFALVDHS